MPLTWNRRPEAEPQPEPQDQQPDIASSWIWQPLVRGGSDGDDRILGRLGPDTLSGGAGDDRIRGRWGDDEIDGGSGSDRLFGGRGDDTLAGGDGEDTILGGKGDDEIDGGSGSDRLFGGRGDDTLAGGEGGDTVLGGRGDDLIDGGSGSDRVFAGRGNDTVIYDVAENAGASDRFHGGRGRDVLHLEFGRSDWFRADVQADISDFLGVLEAPRGGFGGRFFRFDAFDLRVRGFESLRITVDGEDIDPEDDPVFANDDAVTLDDVAPATAFASVLANDDVPDLAKAVRLVSGPARGALVFNEGTPGAPDGSFTFDPAGAFDELRADEIARVSFVYEVEDADGDTDRATVTINVVGTNHPPEASADALGALEGTTTRLNVLSNDTDFDGDPLRVGEINGTPVAPGSVVSTTHGQLVVRADGELDYTPSDPDFAGADSFVYRAFDGFDLSEPADVTIDVEARADAPEVSIVQTGAALGRLTFEVSGTLLDGDGSESLTLTIDAPPAGASFAPGTPGLQPDGSVRIDDPSGVETVTLLIDGLSDLDFDLIARATATEASNSDQATSVASAPVAVHVGTASRDVTLAGVTGDGESLAFEGDFYTRLKSRDLPGSFSSDGSIHAVLDLDLGFLGLGKIEIFDIGLIYDAQIWLGHETDLTYDPTQVILEWDLDLQSQYDAGSDTLFLLPTVELDADGTEIVTSLATANVTPWLGWGVFMQHWLRLMGETVYDLRLANDTIPGFNRTYDSVGTLSTDGADGEVSLLGFKLDPGDSFTSKHHYGADATTDADGTILSSSFRHDAPTIGLDLKEFPPNPFGKKITADASAGSGGLSVEFDANIDVALLNLLASYDLGTSWTYDIRPGEFVGQLNLLDGTQLALSSGEVLVIENASERLAREIDAMGQETGEFVLDFDFASTGAEVRYTIAQDDDLNVTAEIFDLESFRASLSARFLGASVDLGVDASRILDLFDDFNRSTEWNLTNPGTTDDPYTSEFTALALTQQSDMVVVL